MKSLYCKPTLLHILATLLVFILIFTVPQVVFAAEKSPSRTALYELQEAFTAIADEVLPSVVSITSKKTEVIRTPWFDDDFFKDFPFPFPQPKEPKGREQKTTSFGSGVIVRSDGYILTNDHVVGDAESVKVTLKDGREFDGKVLRDPRSDLALVKIDAENLPAAKLGDSSTVKVGQWAIAIGSPFGLDRTVTVGIISATGRQAAAPEGAGFYPNLIQTDASINPGNSGGPLVNIEGEVIGINTLIRSSIGANVGIGFAIPVNTAKFVLNQLIEHGKVTRGFLGLVPTDITPKVAERLGVKEGVLIRSVEVGSPADKAGIQAEDVITQFDGKPVKDEITFREMVASAPPGKQVSVVIVRDKKPITLTVTLGEAPEVAEAETPKESETRLGFSAANITPELITKFKLDENAKGVVITNVVSDSSAEYAGLKPGMIITKANGQNITTVDDLTAATKDLKSGDTLRLIVRTKERQAFIEFTLD